MARRTPSGAFARTYDALLRSWPVQYEAQDVMTPYGTTRAICSGPPDAPPLVLLPGAGATALAWRNNVAAWSTSHRVYAVDLLGDVGYSQPDGLPVRGLDDLCGWLAAVLDHTGEQPATLMGHSYGGWLAASFALRHPGRLAQLILLDPASVLTGLALRYRLRAVPALLLRRPASTRSFVHWETAGLDLDRQWLEVACAAAAQSVAPLVWPRRPAEPALSTLTVPTLVIAAEHSRTSDAAELVAAAQRLLPQVETQILGDTSHHSVPGGHAAVLNAVVADFLATAAPTASSMDER